MDEAKRELLCAWLTKAANDLKNAGIVSEAADGPLDTAIYHCQQAAEKVVKAFLLYHDREPEKTHDIRKLTVQAMAFAPEFKEHLAAASALTPFAWEFRYPNDFAETYPTDEEFNEALKQARAIYDFVLSLLPAETHPAQEKSKP